MSNAAAERAYVAAVCDNADDALHRATAHMADQLDALREEWSSGAAHQLAAAEAVRRKLQEDSLSWLRARYDDEPRKLAAPNNVAADDRTGAPSVLTSTPIGHSDHPQRPTQQELNERELAEAARIRSLSMQQFAMERNELIRPGRGLF